MIFKTKRLIIGPPRPSDWKDLVEGLNNRKVSFDMGAMIFPYKKKNASEWINWNIKKWKNQSKEGCSWVIELRSEKKVIGATGVFKIDNFSKKAEVGYWINQNYWRNNYLFEANTQVIDFAFNKLLLSRLEAVTFTDNIGSQRALEKLGYKQEGYLRKSEKSLANNKLHDQYFYGLLKEDWKKIRSKLIKELNQKLK